MDKNKKGISNGKKQGEDKITIEFKTIILWIIIIGLPIYILTSFKYNFKDDDIELAILNLINGIAATLLSAVAVSLILEQSTINDKIKNAFKDLLQLDFPIEGYSIDNLNTLNVKVACERCNQIVQRNELSNSIYTLEPQLLKLAEGLYFNHHTSIVKVTPLQDQKCFKKNVEMEYEIVNNHSSDNHVRVELALNPVDNKPIKQVSDVFKITKFTINDTDLINEVDSYLSLTNIPKSDTSTYEYKISFDRPLQMCQAHKVILHYEYISPINDFAQGYKLMYPAKNFCHEIVLNHDPITREAWNIRLNAFSMNCSTNDNYVLKAKQNTKQTCNVKADDWVLPGSGYYLYFSKD